MQAVHGNKRNRVVSILSLSQITNMEPESQNTATAPSKRRPNWHRKEPKLKKEITH
jgi:hypothetical protein